MGLCICVPIILYNSKIEEVDKSSYKSKIEEFIKASRARQSKTFFNTPDLRSLALHVLETSISKLMIYYLSLFFKFTGLLKPRPLLLIIFAFLSCLSVLKTAT